MSDNNIANSLEFLREVIDGKYSYYNNVKLCNSIKTILDALQSAEKRAEEAEELGKSWRRVAEAVERKNLSVREENARLTNNNARLRERIHDLRLGIKFILHESEYTKNKGSLSKIAWKARLLLKDNQALLPSGNKDPRSDEINPMGTDFGVFAEKREFPS